MKQKNTNEKNTPPVLSSKKHQPLAQRASDHLTGFMGSWTFISIFVAYILIWMVLNLYAWVNQWDPYPFILLNLTLSCLAALQAPIILMSQNRQSEKDRAMARYDYQIDRKTEREIRDIQSDLELIKADLKTIISQTKNN